MTYLRRIARALLQERRAVTWITGAAALEALAGLISPWVASRVLDTALPNAAGQMLAVLAFAIVVAVAHTAWAGFWHKRTTVVLQHRLETLCLRDLLESYLATPYSRLQSSRFGNTNETFAAAAAIVTSVVSSLVECVTLSASGFAALVMLAMYEPWLAAATLGLAALTALLSLLTSFAEASRAEEVLEASSQSQELLHVLLRAVATLRASGATDRLTRQWASLLRKQTVASIAQEEARLNRTVLVQAGQQLTNWGATAWLVHLALERAITLGELMTCTLLVGNVLRVTVGVTQVWVAWSTLRPHFARANALLSSSAEPGVPRPVRVVAPLATGSEGVHLENVWFRYGSATRWVLEAHTQLFPAGQHTVLRASSGFGKSTILRLVSGLLKPERGRVSVLGYDPAVTRGLVAYVPQQAMLVEGSIATNLTVLSGASLERVLEVAELTGLSDLLARLPMGVETLISAIGSNLSAGQRQLVMLTAVFATAHPVVLLDESVSQLDVGTRGRIRWDALCADRTIISVQHA